MEQQKPPCKHYKRNCSIISPCCGMVFGCRLCHDDCDNLSLPIFNKDHMVNNDEDEEFHIPQKIKLENGSKAHSARQRGSVSSLMSAISESGDDVHHTIDRFAVKEIICRSRSWRNATACTEQIDTHSILVPPFSIVGVLVPRQAD